MKRDEEADEMNSTKHSGRLLSSELRFGEDPHSDSSDDDTSTFKSPVCVCFTVICNRCEVMSVVIQSA